MTTRGFNLVSYGVSIIGNSSRLCVGAVIRSFSFVFVSPTHHNAGNRGIFSVTSYAPGLLNLRGRLLTGTPAMLVGLSPVLSVALTVRRLSGVTRVRIIDITGRYGRLLFLLGQNCSSAPAMATMGLNSRSLATALRGRSTAPLQAASRIKGCVCRPCASILGTKFFGVLARQFPILGLRVGSRLCASSSLVTRFPKQGFTISEIVPFGGGTTERLKLLHGTGVAIHGFPLSPSRLQGGLGLNSKNGRCVFTAAVARGSGVLVLYCQP